MVGISYFMSLSLVRKLWVTILIPQLFPVLSGLATSIDLQAFSLNGNVFYQ